jgi:hypothetical protein
MTDQFVRRAYGVPRRLMAPACHQLPYGEVYLTPHSDRRHWQIANDNLVLLTQVGSGLHGVVDDEYDDRDEQGVCIEPPSVMLGFDDFRLYKYRTQPLGDRSGPGDLDVDVYGLRTWVDLICAGNATHLLPLFAPPEAVVAIDWPGEQMRQHRDLFLARSHGERFLGYLRRQRALMLGERSNRPELIERYGFDTKYAYHALRIALQGIQLMSLHEIALPMLDGQREWLTGVRTGTFNRDYVVTELARHEQMLVDAITASSLPDCVDYPRVNQWLAITYLSWWTQRAQEEDAGVELSAPRRGP